MLRLASGDGSSLCKTKHNIQLGDAMHGLRRY
jgi:hypothetical protein